MRAFIRQLADDPMPALGEELGETAGPASGVQRHARLPAAEVLGHDRLVDCEQPTARVRVVSGGLLLDQYGNVLKSLQNNVVRDGLIFDPTAHGERQLVDWYFAERAKGRELPPPEANGVSYLKIPLNAL